MRRLLSLVMIFMSLVLTGCKETIFEPVPMVDSIEIIRPQQDTVFLYTNGWSNVNLTVLAPAGVDPIIDVEILPSNEKPVSARLVGTPYFNRTEVDSDCGYPCKRVRWDIFYTIEASSTGLGEITFTVRQSPNMRLTRPIYSQESWNAKG